MLWMNREKCCFSMGHVCAGLKSAVETFREQILERNKQEA